MTTHALIGFTDDDWDYRYQNTLEMTANGFLENVEKVFDDVVDFISTNKPPYLSPEKISAIYCYCSTKIDLQKNDWYNHIGTPMDTEFNYDDLQFSIKLVGNYESTGEATLELYENDDGWKLVKSKIVKYW